jgi:hypothetical protein
VAAQEAKKYRMPPAEELEPDVAAEEELMKAQLSHRTGGHLTCSPGVVRACWRAGAAPPPPPPLQARGGSAAMAGAPELLRWLLTPEPAAHPAGQAGELAAEVDKRSAVELYGLRKVGHPTLPCRLGSQPACSASRAGAAIGVPAPRPLGKPPNNALMGGEP